ncbi:MAG: hypothetical protein AMXMBFR34_36300 [Myxococcaceae bacterium]
MTFDAAWRKEMTAEFNHLLDTLHDGTLWESYGRTARREAKRWLKGKVGVGNEGPAPDSLCLSAKEAHPRLQAVPPCAAGWSADNCVEAHG